MGAAVEMDRVAARQPGNTWASSFRTTSSGKNLRDVLDNESEHHYDQAYLRSHQGGDGVHIRNGPLGSSGSPARDTEDAMRRPHATSHRWNKQHDIMLQYGRGAGSQGLSLGRSTAAGRQHLRGTPNSSDFDAHDAEYRDDSPLGSVEHGRQGPVQGGDSVTDESRAAAHHALQPGSNNVKQEPGVRRGGTVHSDYRAAQRRPIITIIRRVGKSPTVMSGEGVEQTGSQEQGITVRMLVHFLADGRFEQARHIAEQSREATGTRQSIRLYASAQDLAVFESLHRIRSSVAGLYGRASRYGADPEWQAWLDNMNVMRQTRELCPHLGLTGHWPDPPAVKGVSSSLDAKRTYVINRAFWEAAFHSGDRDDVSCPECDGRGDNSEPLQYPILQSDAHKGEMQSAMGAVWRPVTAIGTWRPAGARRLRSRMEREVSRIGAQASQRRSGRSRQSRRRRSSATSAASGTGYQAAMQGSASPLHDPNHVVEARLGRAGNVRDAGELSPTLEEQPGIGSEELHSGAEAGAVDADGVVEHDSDTLSTSTDAHGSSRHAGSRHGRLRRGDAVHQSHASGSDDSAPGDQDDATRRSLRRYLGGIDGASTSSSRNTTESDAAQGHAAASISSDSSTSGPAARIQAGNVVQEEARANAEQPRLGVRRLASRPSGSSSRSGSGIVQGMAFLRPGTQLNGGTMPPRLTVSSGPNVLGGSYASYELAISPSMPSQAGTGRDASRDAARPHPETPESVQHATASTTMMLPGLRSAYPPQDAMRMRVGRSASSQDAREHLIHFRANSISEQVRLPEGMLMSYLPDSFAAEVKLVYEDSATRLHRAWYYDTRGFVMMLRAAVQPVFGTVCDGSDKSDRLLCVSTNSVFCGRARLRQTIVRMRKYLLQSDGMDLLDARSAYIDDLRKRHAPTRRERRQQRAARGTGYLSCCNPLSQRPRQSEGCIAPDGQECCVVRDSLILHAATDAWNAVWWYTAGTKYWCLRSWSCCMCSCMCRHNNRRVEPSPTGSESPPESSRGSFFQSPRESYEQSGIEAVDAKESPQASSVRDTSGELSSHITTILPGLGTNSSSVGTMIGRLMTAESGTRTGTDPSHDRAGRHWSRESELRFGGVQGWIVGASQQQMPTLGVDAQARPSSSSAAQANAGPAVPLPTLERAGGADSVGQAGSHPAIEVSRVRNLKCDAEDDDDGSEIRSPQLTNSFGRFGSMASSEMSRLDRGAIAFGSAPGSTPKPRSHIPRAGSTHVPRRVSPAQRFPAHHRLLERRHTALAKLSEHESPRGSQSHSLSYSQKRQSTSLYLPTSPGRAVPFNAPGSALRPHKVERDGGSRHQSSVYNQQSREDVVPDEPGRVYPSLQIESSSREQQSASSKSNHAQAHASTSGAVLLRYPQHPVDVLPNYVSFDRRPMRSQGTPGNSIVLTASPPRTASAQGTTPSPAGPSYTVSSRPSPVTDAGFGSDGAAKKHRNVADGGHKSAKNTRHGYPMLPSSRGGAADSPPSHRKQGTSPVICDAIVQLGGVDNTSKRMHGCSARLATARSAPLDYTLETAIASAGRTDSPASPATDPRRPRLAEPAPVPTAVHRSAELTIPYGSQEADPRMWLQWLPPLDGDVPLWQVYYHDVHLVQRLLDGGVIRDDDVRMVWHHAAAAAVSPLDCVCAALGAALASLLMGCEVLFRALLCGCVCCGGSVVPDVTGDLPRLFEAWLWWEFGDDYRERERAIAARIGPSNYNLPVVPRYLGHGGPASGRGGGDGVGDVRGLRGGDDSFHARAEAGRVSPVRAYAEASVLAAHGVPPRALGRK